MNKLLILVIGSLLFGVATAMAQPVQQWHHPYGGGSDDECYSVVQTSDGGYAMAGQTQSFGNGGHDFWLVRTNANGDQLWEKSFGGAGYDECQSLVQTPDGGFALAGFLATQGDGSQFWLIKTDANGDVVWNQTYGGGNSEYCYGMIQTTDGGFALVGSTNSFGAGGGDMWFVKTDANGDVSWDRTFGGAQGEIAIGIIQTADGGYAITGGTASFGNGGDDVWFIRTDANGQNEVTNTYGAAGSEWGSSVLQTPDGGFVIGASTTSYGAGNSDFWIIKTHPNGQFRWDRTFGTPANEYSPTLIETADHEIVMFGWKFVDNYDYWMILMDVDLSPIWDRTFGGQSMDICHDGIQTADGQFAMAGFSYSYGAGNKDFWLVKTGNGFDGYNDFVQTQDEQSIVITAANFDNAPVPTGWEVGVFTPGDVLSGGGIWQHGQALGIAAWGDDNQTQAVEGFVAGEVMNFRLWDNNTNVEYPAVAIVSQGDLIWQDGDATALSLQGYLVYTMDLVLAANWNIISVNVVPSDPNLYTGDPGPEIVPMMAQFGNNLQLMKDEDGRFYWPALNFNNIPYWNLAEGYKVKVSQQQQGSWTGALIPASTNMPIELGWNIIGYFPTYTLSASQSTNPQFHVIQPIVNNVLIAKNSAGQFMIPPNNFSNMPNWMESQGYQIKVNANVVLNYPAHDNNIDAIDPSPIQPDAGHWSTPASTGANMSVLVTSIDGLFTQSGDQIAAFAATGAVVGVGTVQDNGSSGFAVWGDDLSTEAIDGLQNGEAFTLRLWNSKDGAELALETNINQGTLVYETDGFANLSVFASVSVPENFYISESYPNPFNSTTHIAFGLPEAGRLSIGVYDMAGRLVATLAEGEFAAGNHTAVWNADAAPAGLYMVKMQAGSFSDVRKLTLVK